MLSAAAMEAGPSAAGPLAKFDGDLVELLRQLCRRRAEVRRALFLPGPHLHAAA